MMQINDTDKVAAQEWFINNLKINTDNEIMVLDKVNLLLKKHGITIAIKDLPTLLR